MTYICDGCENEAAKYKVTISSQESSIVLDSMDVCEECIESVRFRRQSGRYTEITIEV